MPAATKGDSAVRIAVTGSIATDHLMTFPGRFVEQLVPDMLDKVALSFLVDKLVIRRGGVAANIAFDLGSLAAQAGGFDLVLIGASDPEAMTAFTAQCRQLGIPFATDTSWQLARLDGAQARDLVDGAAYLFCNEYEATLTERKTGWTGGEICAHVGIRVTTLGAAGARVDRAGSPPVIVPPVPDAAPQEPTGAGDAFRAGFLAATSWGLSLERAAQLGNMLAVYALETVGTQEYELKPGHLAERLTAAYGPQAAMDVARHYS